MMLSKQQDVTKPEEHEETEPALDSRHLLLVLGVTVGLRVLVALLTADTYDYDEFVLLLLSRDFAHGAVPYHDFMFFHPPGALVLFGGLEPLTRLWWPFARIVTLLLDSITAVLVWRIAATLYDRRTAVLAGLLYACSPLALISSVRVGQDPIITLLGMTGLMVLVTRRSAWAGTVAGICLGLAVWTKYPALLFLPVYVLAAPRRAPVMMLSAAVTGLVAFAPFAGEAHALYAQTVEFQRTRWLMPVDQRVLTWLLYWLVMNPLALIGVVRLRRPAWLVVGFALGLVFLFAAQTYYHYFVPIVPFGALLSAPVLARFSKVGPRLVTVGGVLLALVWSSTIDLGGSSPLYLTAAHLSRVESAVRRIERLTPPGGAILADRYEYAYLAQRPALAHYFWNVGVLVNARYLERRVPKAAGVVLSYGASSGYPAGFVDYLNVHYPRMATVANTIWIIESR
jgi:hypothetical protein